MVVELSVDFLDIALLPFWTSFVHSISKKLWFRIGLRDYHVSSNCDCGYAKAFSL